MLALLIDADIGLAINLDPAQDGITTGIVVSCFCTSKCNTELAIN
jgi:hypothetical protein